MDKTMLEIRVSTTNDGMIEISQNFDSSDSEMIDSIRIAPNQVDILIEWLTEARAELEE